MRAAREQALGLRVSWPLKGSAHRSVLSYLRNLADRGTSMHLGKSVSLASAQERLHRSVPFMLEQSKVVFVLETVAEVVALAQVSLIGKAKLE